jgi:hypothetical protein
MYPGLEAVVQVVLTEEGRVGGAEGGREGKDREAGGWAVGPTGRAKGGRAHSRKRVDVQQNKGLHAQISLYKVVSAEGS